MFKQVRIPDNLLLEKYINSKNKEDRNRLLILAVFLIPSIYGYITHFGSNMSFFFSILKSLF